jgi:hypothetical protein
MGPNAHRPLARTGKSGILVAAAAAAAGGGAVGRQLTSAVYTRTMLRGAAPPSAASSLAAAGACKRDEWLDAVSGLRHWATWPPSARRSAWRWCSYGSCISSRAVSALPAAPVATVSKRGYYTEPLLKHDP